MAKRFINSEIFEDTWFSDLPLKYKMFWIYILTRCNHAGVWQVNYKHACFNIGDHLEPSECERLFRERIVKIENGQYWFIPKFVTFQYGDKLSAKNKAHQYVIKVLEKYNLYKYIENNDLSTEETFTLQAPDKELADSFEGVKDKDKVKDKDMVKEKDKEKDKEKAKEKEFKEEAENFQKPAIEKPKESPPDSETTEIMEFIRTNAPRVNQLKHPLKAQECKKLLDDFDKQVIKDTLLDMENYKKLLTCYESANLTLRKWIKMRLENQGSVKKIPKYFTSKENTETEFKYTDPIEAMKNGGL